ncbi:MAG: TolC family protein, partial [Heliobacteriaceae bacterium]|nr:TolC family protein [Heliobacteriaceae bacterium]
MKRIILILFLLTMPARAELLYLAGIDEAIDIAMRNSGELRAAQARFGVTEAQVFTANTRLNPVFIADSGFADKDYRTGIQMIIETAGKRKKRTQAARIQHEIVKDEIDTKILDIKSNVRKAYIELYAAQRKKQLIEDIIYVIDSLNKSRKTASRSDMINAEMIRLNAQIELHSVQSEINEAHSSLNAFLGNQLHKDGVLETPALEHNYRDIAALSQEQHNLNIENLNIIAFENRPELRLQKNSIELAKKQLEIAKANRVPNVLIASGPNFAVNNPGT